VTWRNYPLPFHPNATPAAVAAMTVRAQKGDDAFWKFHDKVFTNQQQLDAATYEKYAGELGCDLGKFKAAVAANTQKAEVDADVAYANGLGTGGMGTPTFFINGRMVSGAQPIDAFAKVIDEELGKKK
jgi:protein-disulfide isomerase